VILSPFAPVAVPVAATFVILVTVPALALVLLALAHLDPAHSDEGCLRPRQAQRRASPTPRPTAPEPR
jgi:hypothetical protein